MRFEEVSMCEFLNAVKMLGPTSFRINGDAIIFWPQPTTFNDAQPRKKRVQGKKISYFLPQQAQKASAGTEKMKKSCGREKIISFETDEKIPQTCWDDFPPK